MEGRNGARLRAGGQWTTCHLYFFSISRLAVARSVEREGGVRALLSDLNGASSPIETSIDNLAEQLQVDFGIAAHDLSRGDTPTAADEPVADGSGTVCVSCGRQEGRR